LFPQADRGMVLLCEGDHYHVRAQRLRYQPPHDLDPAGGSAPAGHYPFSRSLVRHALDEGVGLLSENGGRDVKLSRTGSVPLDLSSFLCVPLLGVNDRKIGVIQLDCLCQGRSFKQEDLEVLTVLALQVSVVLENAALHAERLREEKLRQELKTAREIQQAFLPKNFKPAGEQQSYDLVACVHPAREVSAALYDFFPLAEARLECVPG